MLLPGSRFDLPFTCVDSTGAAASPTGTPTAVLVQNGTDLGTTVTVTMTGAQGIATCTIPSSGVNAGDNFYIRISAVISGTTYVVAGPAMVIADLAAVAAQVRTELATELARLDVAVGTRLATAGYTAPTTPPTAAAIASQVRTELTTELGRVDAAISSRLATVGYTAPPSAVTNASQVRTELATELGRIDAAVSSRLATSGYTAPTTPPTAAAIADEVRVELATELARIDAAISSRLATVGYTAPPSIAGLATSSAVTALAVDVAALPDAGDVAAAILATPSNKLATNGSGYVTATNGGGTSFVMPLVSESSRRVTSTPLELFTGEAMEITLSVVDRSGVAVNLSGRELIFRMSRPPVSVRTLADLRSFEMSAITDDDWVDHDEVDELAGDSGGHVVLDAPEFATRQSGPLSFSLRDADTNEVLSRGVIMVQYAA